MKHPLSAEPKEVLEEVLRDVGELLEEQEADEVVRSEMDLRRMVRVTGRARVLLVREMERAEAVRSRLSGRSFDPPPALGTLLRLARLEVQRALSDARR